MSDIQNLLPMLSSRGQPPVTFGQLIHFVALSSRLRNQVLLVQPGSFDVTRNQRAILPQSIQEFLSDACMMPLPSVNIIWEFIAPTAWKMEYDISPLLSGMDIRATYKKYGYSRGLSESKLRI